MRKGIHNAGISIHAIAGTNVITLAFDAKKETSKNLMGFSIFRTKCNKDGMPIDEGRWMLGYKPFEELVPEPLPEVKYPTNEHPWQSFVWSDFAVEQGKTYRYKVHPAFGAAGAIILGDSLEIFVAPEPVKHRLHEIFFNRGTAASQAYAEQFDNIKPNDPSLSEAEKNKRYKWLSRGLFEAVKKYIEQAKDSTFGLRAAIYELDYPSIPVFFKAAADRGADVKIIYEAREGESQTKQNQDALKNAGLNINDKKITFARKNTSGIPHNKFIVLLKDDKPVMVWTGSTNLSEGGIFGHANLGHCIKDKAVAEAYLEYWKLLKPDPDRATLAEKVSSKWPDISLADLPIDKMSVLFSPRRGLKMMDFYADVDKRFVAKIDEDTAAVRYIILNSGKPKEEIAEKFNPDFDVIIAPGSRMEDQWGQWLKEINPVKNGSNVLYIHTKFIITDPLGPHPLVITGSANFSENSTNTNDENMLIIPCSNEPGKTRVQDIYFGEFFRLFDHLYFRYLHSIDTSSPDEIRKRRFLKATSKEWVDPYYKWGSDRFKRRVHFSFGFE
jgi:hypothetical protein